MDWLNNLTYITRSKRVWTLTLLSFSLGIPCGLFSIAVPDWMRSIGVDIRIVGLVSLVQIPWIFMFAISPFMDRFQFSTSRRWTGWMLTSMLIILLLMFGLSLLGDRPRIPTTILLITFGIALATTLQEIAVGAHGVEVLHVNEHAIVGGARSALFRLGTGVSGGLAITFAAWIGWHNVNMTLALLFIPLIWVAWHAPVPIERFHPPANLKTAIWEPFKDLIARKDAKILLLFIFFYKIGDGLAGSLVRPFLIDIGYTALDRGLVLAIAALGLGIVGTFVGGILTERFGLGNALWVFGILQVVSNAGYLVIAHVGINRPVLYLATAFEHFTGGLGTAAFSILVLRITKKRFSATQHSIFVSTSSLPGILSGPISGLSVYAMGWNHFFWMTIIAGIPGLWILHKIIPFQQRARGIPI